uniref:Uncharacterized protein n=1 Tax=Rheinheimera sp. BAL341 TaxID=1708203 RepID=A0A486XY40_9GAMM
MSLLIGMTFLSPFSQLTPGAFVPYLTFTLLCSVRIDKLSLNSAQQKFLLSVSVIVALLCFLAFFRVAIVMDIQESYYQMFPDLYKFMMMWANKPVLMFATHSVAGFAYYLIAICLLAAYLSQIDLKHRWVLLLLSITYSVILVLLLSNTGLALFLMLLGIYSVLFLRYGKPVAVLLVLFSITAVVLYFYQPILLVIDMATDLVVEVLSRKENGLLARFSTESRLGGSINYLTASPVVGVGMTSGGDIAFGDSFYAEYMLRLGFWGYFLVAFVTYGYLFINTKAKKYFFALAMLVFIADLGYPLFVTYRFVFLFPVVIILLNTLSRHTQSGPELK